MTTKTQQMPYEAEAKFAAEDRAEVARELRFALMDARGALYDAQRESGVGSSAAIRAADAVVIADRRYLEARQVAR